MGFQLNETDAGNVTSPIQFMGYYEGKRLHSAPVAAGVINNAAFRTLANRFVPCPSVKYSSDSCPLVMLLLEPP